MKSKQLQRRVVEALVIVGSILLAFAIDAWWDNYLDRNVEQNLLLGLHEDLLDDIGDYASAAAGWEQRVVAADLLLMVAGDPAGDAENVEKAIAAGLSVGDAFFQLGGGPILETVRVSYDQITAAGIADVISDPELRRGIARYYALAADRVEGYGANYDTKKRMENYEARLNQLGFTRTDRDGIPAVQVLTDATLRATIRAVREDSAFAASIARGLLNQAEVLKEDVALSLDR